SFVGGLIGFLAGGDGFGGSIQTSWASGKVSTAADSSNVALGGLVGGAGSGSSITRSFWDTFTTGQQFAIGDGTNGGATAVTSDPSQSAAPNYAFSKNVYKNNLDFNNWFMIDG